MKVTELINHLQDILEKYGDYNVLIETDNQEIPIMDGSARPFYEKLSKAELVTQSQPCKILKVLKN